MFRQQTIQQQMQSIDEKNIHRPSNGIIRKKDNSISTEGNDETKILAAAIGEALKSGGTISDKEKKAIEKMDNVFDNVDVVISKDGHNAYLVQADGKNFKMGREK